MFINCCSKKYIILYSSKALITNSQSPIETQHLKHNIINAMDQNSLMALNG